MYPQHVEHLDIVCYDFPELTLVTRHGCEPWTDLAVKLMLKWPGLHYSTSAFAPKHYPKDIINYANGINGQYGFLLGQVEGNPVVTEPVKARLVELERVWAALRTEVETVETVDVANFNRLLQAAKVEGVISKKKPGTIM